VAAFPGKGRRKTHEEELARLKRDLARVTQEQDFLKSVAAYFAKPSP
jgi:transposase